MSDFGELLEVTKTIVSKAASSILSGQDIESKHYIHCANMPKEIKAFADDALNRDILSELLPLGIPVLSEESGYTNSSTHTDFCFVVDPLDGTFNFVKGLGPSAVSIALWHDKTPVFGVIYNLSERKLFWGGRGLGAFVDDEPIMVSATGDRRIASICTGFPVRFDVEDSQTIDEFWRTVHPFGKVRMIGSAAISLTLVAQGAADVYFEQGIMLWDVAAGLAIVQGAGGYTSFTPTPTQYSLNVFASNGKTDLCNT